MAARLAAVVLVAAVAAAALLAGAAGYKLTKKGTVVTYDARSIIIGGRREMFFSGSVHYPRSPPEMWPEIIRKAKAGGLNMIQTYVFWNAHEPQEGKYDFEGRHDLVKFIKLIKQHDMYACVRIGPFIQAEWTYGGFPYWLREKPGIIFRTDNEPYKKYMEKFVRMIVQKLKDARLYAPQGGPIILSQIENEYGILEEAFKENGTNYLHWAAEMAISTQTGVPWIMCKQTKAPGDVIPTCNGRHCGDTWTQDPQEKNKPWLWTENWTAQFRVFGDPPSQRSAEDIAYSVARWFAKGGTMTNYYMYYGGTNFGRTGASLVMTRYYDEGPLDEFGMPKEPKYGHLTDLHHALHLCKKALLFGNHTYEKLATGYEANTYELPEQKVCITFLSNSDTNNDGTITFRGERYFVPRRSVSILGDCKTVVYNTQRVNSHHNERSYNVSDVLDKNTAWEMFTERIPKYSKCGIKVNKPAEQFNRTKDTTDYMWYTTSFRLDADDLPFRRDIRPVVQAASHGHALLAFANHALVGCEHGRKMEKGFLFEKPTDLKVGVNHLAFLSSTVGMKDSGGYLESTKAGIRKCNVQGLNTGTLDLTHNGWGLRIGLKGEKKRIYTEEGAASVRWKPAQSGRPLVWYKRYFDEPDGDEPIAIDMTSMGKGMLYVNGEGLGRHWSSFRTALGEPSQTIYHVPRAFLKPKNNLLVFFDEEGGDPELIRITKVLRDDVCALVSENNPAHVRSWTREDSQLKLVATDLKATAVLTCPRGKTVHKVVFASFGNPAGTCGNFTAGACHTPKAKQVVEKECLGKKTCTLPVAHQLYGGGLECPGTAATLAVQVKCSKSKAGDSD